MDGVGTCGGCPVQNYYIQGPKCMKCHPTCLQCSGSSATNCTACASPNILMPLNKSCTSCNFDKFYKSGSSCLPCDEACLSCVGPSDQLCSKCASGYYRNPFDMTCISSCPDPLSEDSSTMDCAIPDSDPVYYSNDFQIAFDAGTLKVHESMRTQRIQAVTELLLNFESQKSGSGCPTCSSQGSCNYFSDYKSEKCVCNDGFNGTNCFLTSYQASSLQLATTNIFNYISSQASLLDLKTNTNDMTAYLDSMLRLVSSSFTTDAEVENAFNVIQKIVVQGLSSRGANDQFDPSKLQKILQIYDACLQYVNSQDCNIEKQVSQDIYNASVALFNNLSILQLNGKTINNTQSILNSTHIDLGSIRMQGSVGANLSFGTPPTIAQFAPQIELDPRIILDVHVAHWKTDLANCPNDRNSSKPPLLLVTINDMNSALSSQYSGNFSARLFYPVEAGQKYAGCENSCNPSSIILGVLSYFECFCSSVSSLNSSLVLFKLFAESNFWKLLKWSALANYDYLHSWAFWMLFALFCWYLLSLLAINLRIISPLSYKIPPGTTLNVTLKNFKIDAPLIKILSKALFVSFFV